MHIRHIIVSKDTSADAMFRESLLLAGGVFIMSCESQKLFPAYKAAMPKTPEFEDITYDTRLCLMLEEFANRLTEDEMEAVLLHEEGHAVLGHMPEGTSGMLIDPEFEFEADKYAADNSSPAALFSALRKVEKFVYDTTAPAMADGDEEYLEILLESLKLSFNINLKPRFDRLLAMMG